MATKIITPKALFSYPHLAEPSADLQGRLKYSVCLVFLSGTDLSAVKAAIVEAAKSKWGEKATAMLKAGKLRSPLRYDVEEKGYPEGACFMNVRSNQAPGIVGPYNGPNGKPAPYEGEIYPGILGRASLAAFPYDNSGNKGVSFGLNNVQILDDTAPRLDGRLNAGDEFDGEDREFAAMEAEDGKPARGGYDDLL